MPRRDLKDFRFMPFGCLHFQCEYICFSLKDLCGNIKKMTHKISIILPSLLGAQVFTEKPEEKQISCHPKIVNFNRVDN
ncbi:CLUMA_CG019361, isoform A [Clunio marinus]|uniref:CLUMA_CG019361, isoform A n=1 Tax=Clunio marinus TaxID=568069 RepID=A0A1J1J156_9DIPT|nr:CLUMA_CG019361, isoform A [Clunio marinus]